MAQAIFNVLFKIIKVILDVVLVVPNLLVKNMFPDLSSLLTNFNSYVVKYVGNGLGWFSSILPPVTKTMILLYLTILIGYYTVTWSLHAYLKVYQIIQKIKFW